MNIGRQWSDRLRLWAEQFPKHYYRPAAQLPAEYFTTMEHLSCAQAFQGPFAPVLPGEKWGKKWEYAWFRTEITVPEALAGKRLVFTLAVGPEMLVWVNGAEAGAMDRHHRFITLSRCAEAGTRYEILAECYAGHGIRNEGAGIVAWGEESVPEPPEQQVTVGVSSFGVWNEPLFQVAMDYLTLYSLVQKLPEKSLRTMKIVEGLKQFTYLADFELPEPEMTESVIRAGAVLKPLLACHNGSTAPDYTVFGQSHLDLAWLWPVEETQRKTARTYSNQLALMEEYEDFRFLLCEPPILEYLRELYPNVYERVKDGVAQGKFYPEGGLWVESDTNIPSGESLIRQFVWGKRWFRQELGAQSRLAWMPDTFGFSAALPQIMKKCQIPYFATQKLIRQDPEADPFPYNLFWWEGMDGSRVLAHTFKKNNAVFQSGDLITRWEEDRVQQENIDGLMYPFGYGDGGGGPTREMVEMARRCADLEGAPRCHMESPAAWFDRQSNVENVYRGELYLAWHRGTLTSQAKTKRGIRKAEVKLRQVEYTMSQRMLEGCVIRDSWKQELDNLWKILLFNQFHDIAAGASLARVHARAEAELEEVMERANSLLAALLGKPGGDTVAHNHLSWPVRFRGQEIPAQGCALLTGEASSGATVRVCQEQGLFELRNAHMVCLFDTKGCLISVKIPGSDREFLAGPGNRFRMYKDVNTCYDAWELGSMYENLPVELSELVEIQPFVSSDGAGLVVERMLHESHTVQRILLGHDARRLDFATVIDWQERHKLLKVAFPVNVYSDEAIHEIQFGYIKRPNHRSRQHDRDQYEVCNHRYTALEDGGAGAALLNDGKYGISVAGNELRLTLLKAALMPDMGADRGIQEMTYSFCPFQGPFRQSGVLREAVELNEPPILGAKTGNTKPIFLPRENNIVVETVKPADTAENCLLVRAYEAMGMQTTAAFTVAENVKKIEETDMLEENAAAVDISRVAFGPFEIKTFLLYL